MPRKPSSKYVEAPPRLLRSTADKTVIASPMTVVLGDFMGITRQADDPFVVATSATMAPIPAVIAPLVVPILVELVLPLAPVLKETVPPVVLVPLEKKKFSDVLKSNSKGMALDFIPKCSDTVMIDLDDVEDELDYWSTTLVCTVLGRRVSLAQFQSLVHKHWSHITAPDVLYFAKDWYYFCFQSQEDMDNILQGPSWNINGYPIIFKVWYPTVSQELDVISVVPLWVFFPNLDPYLWSAKALSKLASRIGRPICADEHTTSKTKVSFARVLIEVDVSKTLPSAITVATPYDDKFIQNVDYEWVPYY
ncbi:hypothetical protein vseg_015266 [Gypsophila vaccaria]